jgi:hypothetical protein
MLDIASFDAATASSESTMYTASRERIAAATKE